MTENEHLKPLTPGEIRRHTVAGQTFQIMHAVAGTYVQVAIRVEDEPTHVVCLEMAMDEHKALAAYAELIRIAELIAAPVIDAHGEALIEDWQRVRSAHLESVYGKLAAAPAELIRIAERARVGDVIERGGVIPANVRALRDKVKDLWAPRQGGWTLAEYDGTLVTEHEAADAEPASEAHLLTFWSPLTVIEIDSGPQPGDSEDEDATWSLTPEGTEALRVRAGFEPTMASETNPHPTAPGGIWDTMGTCPECGTPTGFPCVEVEIWSDGKRLQRHPHANRPSATAERVVLPPVDDHIMSLIAGYAGALRPTSENVAAVQRHIGLASARALASTFGGAIVDPADALPTPVPTRADDVAALREEIAQACGDEDVATALQMLARLDRIVGAVPQRATYNAGPFWLHACGEIGCGEIRPDGLWCERCDTLADRDWQALYVLGGAA